MKRHDWFIVFIILLGCVLVGLSLTTEVFPPNPYEGLLDYTNATIIGAKESTLIIFSNRNDKEVSLCLFYDQKQLTLMMFKRDGKFFACIPPNPTKQITETEASEALRRWFAENFSPQPALMATL